MALEAHPSFSKRSLANSPIEIENCGVSMSGRINTLIHSRLNGNAEWWSLLSDLHSTNLSISIGFPFSTVILSVPLGGRLTLATSETRRTHWCGTKIKAPDKALKNFNF
jgi:hypothetical protein